MRSCYVVLFGQYYETTQTELLVAAPKSKQAFEKKNLQITPIKT